jgi:hypothetical protein
MKKIIIFFSLTLFILSFQNSTAGESTEQMIFALKGQKIDFNRYRLYFIGPVQQEAWDYDGDNTIDWVCGKNKNEDNSYVYKTIGIYKARYIVELDNNEFIERFYTIHVTHPDFESESARVLEAGFDQVLEINNPLGLQHKEKENNQYTDEVYFDYLTESN